MGPEVGRWSVVNIHTSYTDLIYCSFATLGTSCTRSKNLINLSEMLCVHNQIQVCSDVSEKNLTNSRFCKPRPWGMWCKRSNSQFQMSNHRDWGIMGYNDVIVCVTVINLTNAFFFIGLDRSHLTNLINRIVDYECNRWYQQLYWRLLLLLTTSTTRADDDDECVLFQNLTNLDRSGST